MVTISRWGSPTSSVTVLACSVLNDVADGGNELSAAVSNDTDLYFYADFKLNVSATTANRTAGAYVALYLLQDLGGDSDYTFGTSSLDPPSDAWVGNLSYDSGATAARVNHLPKVLLPPANFKILVENNLGVPFTSCTVLTMKRYHVQAS